MDSGGYLVYTKFLGYSEQNTDPSLTGLSLSDFSMILPLLINERSLPIVDNAYASKYYAKNNTDGFFNYVDIRYANSNKQQRVFYNLRTFPLASKFDCEANTDPRHLEKRDYCKRLVNNILGFLPDFLPTIRDKVSFFRDTFIEETIENAVQSSFAIEQRLDKEQNKNHGVEYYQELSEKGFLNSIFEVSYEYDVLSPNRRAHIVSFKNYAKESQYHIERIKKRLELGADTSADEALLVLEEELMKESSCTGNGGYSLFMAEKGLKNDLDADLYFKFVPLKESIFAPGFGSYNFTVIIPEEGKLSIN